MARTITYKRRTKTGKMTTVRRRVAGNGPKPKPGPSVKSRAGKVLHQAERKAGQVARSAKRYVAPGAKRVLHGAERRAGAAVKSVQKSIKTYQSAPAKRQGIKASAYWTVRDNTTFSDAKKGDQFFMESPRRTGTYNRVPKNFRISVKTERTGPGGLFRGKVARVVKSPPKR